MAANKDISGRALKQGDTVLVPALVPAKITAISPEGLLTTKTTTSLFAGGEKEELLVMAGQAQKWTPPG